MEIIDRISQLEREVADLRARGGGKSQRSKPINQRAYEKALDAWLGGDRKALDEYKRHYRVPT